MINYGENLKFHRELAGLNQPELAKKLKTSQANISRWERGEVLPSIEFCIKLAEFYGVTIDELLGVTEDAVYLAPNPAWVEFCKYHNYPNSATQNADSFTLEERQLIEEYRKLPKTSKELVLRMVGITEKKNV